MWEKCITWQVRNMKYVFLAMAAPCGGTGVTVVMEEIEGTGTYASPVPSKKKKKHKSTGNHGEKVKKPRSVLAGFPWLLCQVWEQFSVFLREVCGTLGTLLNTVCKTLLWRFGPALNPCLCGCYPCLM